MWGTQPVGAPFDQAASGRPILPSRSTRGCREDSTWGDVMCPRETKTHAHETSGILTSKGAAAHRQHRYVRPVLRESVRRAPVYAARGDYRPCVTWESSAGLETDWDPECYPNSSQRLPKLKESLVWAGQGFLKITCG